ncbi:MAG TPA: hypothetical protein VG937_02060 [Polyangiaceae bacterium]|nr:hypothetical protein [Polyangiaceae bacterium]
MVEKSRNKFTLPGIAERIIEYLKSVKGSRVVDLGVFRQAREAILEQQAKATEGLEELHPFHAVATHVVGTVTHAANQIGQLSELSKLMDRIETAEEDYGPSGPPMSPITRSYFLYWTLFDLGIGLKNETLGSCVAAVSKAMGADQGYVEFVEHLCRTRPGIYLCEGRDGDAFILRELVTGREHSTIVTSDYQADVGDLLLLRLLPPIPPHFRQALALTTPYRIVRPGPVAWQAYFDRTLPAPTAATTRVSAYEALMKRGTAPRGARYWTEYIFEAYVNHQTEVIFLEGLPDVDESRPHSKASTDEDPRPPPKTRIVRTLGASELERLPKLSATLIEFGEPFIGGVPPGATLADLTHKLILVELAWNAPFIMQHGSAGSAGEVKRQIDARFPLLPPALRRTLEKMLRERTTLYAYDPRLASAKAVSDGKGGFTVLAESRLLDGPPAGWRAP